MPRLIAQTLAATLTIAAAATQAPAQAPAAEVLVPEIVSSASAERSAPADLAVVTLRFSRTGLTPAEAGRSLAQKADSIRRALRPLGIAPDSIVSGSRWYWWRGRIEVVQTGRMVPRWIEQEGRRYRQDSTVVDTTYRAHESLQVRIRDMDRVGAVIDVALAHGVTEISDVAFSATDTERQQREATLEATRRARARAEDIASAAGARLGRTLRLSTEGDHRPSPYGYLSLDAIGTTAGGAQGAPAGTVVVAPVIRVTATVHGRWELVEDR